MSEWSRHAGVASRRNRVRSTGRRGAPVLMLVHGFGCDQEIWRCLVPHLGTAHRLVAFDHVGSGRSDLSAYDRLRHASLDGYAADLLEICEELDLRDVVLVAHSVGAMISVVAAIVEPDRFDRLVLLAPSPCFIDDPDDGYVGGFARSDILDLLASIDSNYRGWAEAMAPAVMGPNGPALTEQLARTFCRQDPTISRMFARLTFLADCRPMLSRVVTPSLLLQCQDDRLAPLAVGDYLKARLADSTLVRLDATGHCPHLSAPEQTAAAVLRYLRTDT